MKSSRKSHLVTAYAAMFTVAAGLLVLDRAGRQVAMAAYETLRIEPVSRKAAPPVLVAAHQPKDRARAAE